MVQVDDRETLSRIQELVAEEHELRDHASSEPDEPARVRRTEEALDQCWDLLRQRRARRTADENPDEAQARPVDEVEGYRQ